MKEPLPFLINTFLRSTNKVVDELTQHGNKEGLKI